MEKNYWNDPVRTMQTYELICDCRSEMRLQVKRYPHGPSQVLCCPMCHAKPEPDGGLKVRVIPT